MMFLVIDGTRYWLSLSKLFKKKHQSEKTSVLGLLGKIGHAKQTNSTEVYDK